MINKTQASDASPRDDVALSPKYLCLIREILDRELLSASRCKVHLFGSRAKNAAHAASDIDLAVDSAEHVEKQIARIQTAFEETEMPFTVDIVDLKSASPAVRQAIKETGTTIWER